MAITSILIANRGEIACRIIRTAKKMGLRTVAVYSDPDCNALHVRLADEAVYIGAADASQSYLNIEKIIEASKTTQADAIHPGYGFLSERAAFAEACKTAGLIFIGPSAQSIKAMGAKDAAKALMQKAGVPVVPGYHGENQDASFLETQAAAIGYPVLIKAVSGGGGKGMRRVDAPALFAENLGSAQREGQNSFGDARVLIEKYVTTPRHIEFQIFGDQHGNYIHLNERDCSLQRRHQKVIEEAPAPGMAADLRAEMGKAAIAAAKAVNYYGAGTVEFIADASEGLRADRFYFMEMNTRLQVEHPVTEAICGVDLVEWQIRVANGEPLPLSQNDIHINGHALEARLYAEDPSRQFFPSTGKLHRLDWPKAHDGLRIDTGVECGDSVTPYYDPMIAKVIVHAANRWQAISGLAAGLEDTKIAGPQTNINFLLRLLSSPAFIAEKFDTSFIGEHLSSLTGKQDNASQLASFALHALLSETSKNNVKSAWDVKDAFQFSKPLSITYTLEIDGERVEAAPLQPESDWLLTSSPKGVFILHKGQQYAANWPDPLDKLNATSSQPSLAAPMNGKITLVHFAKGDKVKAGDTIAVMEAMKMEHAIVAPRDGTLETVNGEPGMQVQQGFIIAHLEAAA